MKLADFTSHYIEGIANMGGKEFKVPLFTHVRGNLYQGGCPDPELPEEFDYVISLYPWGEYQTRKHVISTFAWLHDSTDEPNAGQLDLLSDIAMKYIDRGKTLIHCQAGLNRSALLTVCVMVKMGFSAEIAINLLREQRSSAVLCNDTFSRWLLENL